jgi:hypothetical protein
VLSISYHAYTCSVWLVVLYSHHFMLHLRCCQSKGRVAEHVMLLTPAT